MTSGRGSTGVFTTDRSLVIQTWDPWIADASGVPDAAACGESLGSLFPELSERGLLARLRSVAEGAGVVVLAPALHKYLIPCPPRDRSSPFEHMRQHVTIAPLRDGDRIDGIIVTIEDVTERSERESQWAADLDSADEAVRLRAAKAIAADSETPVRLTEALSDRSWRVRRVAAEGMAVGRDRESVEALVTALREHHRNPALLNAVILALAHTRDDAALAIIPLLAHDDADVRTYAALALGLMDDERAVPGLLERLEDSNVNVRYHAIEALGRIGDRRAVEQLVGVAEQRGFFLAFPALDALASIGDPSMAYRLLPLLDDDLLLPATVACLGAVGTEDVAGQLAAVLGRPGAPIAATALALCDVYERVERTLGDATVVADVVKVAVTEQASHAMIAAISSANRDELRALSMVLSWLSYDGVDHELTRLLGHEVLGEFVASRLSHRGIGAAPFVEQALVAENAPDVRAAAAFVLGRVGSRSSVPALIALLANESDSRVVMATATALGVIGDRRAFSALLPLMDHAESTVRQAAIAALNSIGDPAMEGEIVRRLDDPSPRVRESSARVVGYFGYPSCVDRMLELCDDEEPFVRRAAVEGLANFDDATSSRVYRVLTTDADATVRAAAARALGELTSAESLSVLVHALADSNLWVRYYAARACARRAEATDEVVAALVERARRDPAPPVRIAAIDALGVLAVPEPVDAILELLNDADTDVACAAIVCLGSFDVRRTASTLARELAGPDAGRYRAALLALERQGADAAHVVPALAARVRGAGDDASRNLALQALVTIGNEECIETLTMLGRDHRFAERVTTAIAGLRVDCLPLLERELPRLSPDVRLLVVDGIGRMKHADTGRLLAALLDDPSPKVRDAAERGMRRIDLRAAHLPRAERAGAATTLRDVSREAVATR